MPVGSASMMSSSGAGDAGLRLVRVAVPAPAGVGPEQDPAVLVGHQAQLGDRLGGPVRAQLGEHRRPPRRERDPAGALGVRDAQRSRCASGTRRGAPLPHERAVFVGDLHGRHCDTRRPDARECPAPLIVRGPTTTRSAPDGHGLPACAVEQGGRAGTRGARRERWDTPREGCADRCRRGPRDRARAGCGRVRRRRAASRARPRPAAGEPRRRRTPPCAPTATPSRACRASRPRPGAGQGGVPTSSAAARQQVADLVAVAPPEIAGDWRTVQTLTDQALGLARRHRRRPEPHRPRDPRAPRSARPSPP